MTLPRAFGAAGAFRAASLPSVAKFLCLAFVSATASCGMLIGIEDLNPNGGPDGSSGASGADASSDRISSGGAGGTGGTGGGTSGSSGSAGALPDVKIDQQGDGPGLDATGDVRLDVASDVPAPDVAGDATTADTASPDGGAPDTSAADASDVTTTADAGLPDIANPDTGGLDVSADSVTPDAPVVDVASDTPTTITVTGRIIDYWRHVIPSVPVTIGATSATTDVNGQFVISGVAPPYNVFFTISTIQNNTPAKYGWLYKGLTRTDPTLQVGRGFPQREASAFNVSVANIDFTNLPATEAVHLSFGGVDGMADTDISGTPAQCSQCSWYGPLMTTMNGHALHWTRASSTTLDLPTGYLGYDAQSVSLVASNVANVAFDLANRSIASGAVTGTVNAPIGGGSRENNVFVRFNDNAVIQIAQDATQPTTFSYLVPTLAQGSITVAASTGNWYNAPYAVVHKDGLVAGQTGVTLQIPDAPSLGAPANNATGVNQSTLFRWSGTAKVFLWGIVFENEYKGFFVVTTENQGQIATMPDGPAITPNAPYSWTVETSGSYQSVDEATDASGWLDTYRLGVLGGAVRGDGSYTESETMYFTSAP